MRNKSALTHAQTLAITFFISWACALHSPSSSSHMHVNAVSVTKGLQQPQRMRAPKIADFAKVNGPTATQQLPLPMRRALQQQQQQQQQQDYQTTTSKQQAAAAAADAAAGGKYEIRSVSGEPSYKSVNLTWEVEFVPTSADVNAAAAATSPNATAHELTNASASAALMEPPKAFQVYFCEIQAFGPHRCRFKTVDGNSSTSTSTSNNNDDSSNADVAMFDDGNNNRQIRHYAMQIDNLRMATTYSFHVRATNDATQQQQQQQQSLKRRGGRRAESMLLDENELDNEVLSSGSANRQNELDGQMIVIPTKGFSAEATRCLPHASEIEVQTGPYFGGKIVVDGGNCGVKGNPDDAVDKYTMRIDHKMCGSLVKPETNTVETFITVQENLGIYTHSTRRFVVVCSFQSGMQTVRASFSVPGRGSVATPVENDPFIPDDRSARELNGGIRYVNKSELVLKETNFDDDDAEAAASEDLPSPPEGAVSSEEESAALVHEIPAAVVPSPLPPSNASTSSAIAAATTTTTTTSAMAAANAAQGDTPNAMALLETIQPNINEWHIKHKNDVLKRDDDDDSGDSQNHNNIDDSEADRSVDAQSMPQANYAKLVVDRAAYESDNAWYRTHTNGDGEERAFHLSTLHYITAHMGNVLLAACASVIIFVVFIVLVIREVRRQRKIQLQEQKLQQQQHQDKYDM